MADQSFKHNLRKEKKARQSSCDFEAFCCPGRTEWWRGLIIALVVLMCLLGLVAFIVSWVALTRTGDATSQVVYQLSAGLRSTPTNQVLSGIAAVTLNMPNDVSSYVGKVYHITCDTPHPHKIVITSGSLPTFWTGAVGIRTATCTGGTGSGFSFHVYSNSKIRTFGNSGITFS